MLGDILAGLTDPARAEAVAEAVATPALLLRIREAAAAEGAAAGALIASRVRHAVEHGGEEAWVDLMGAMAGSPQPGAAAVTRLLGRAFPAPERVRITRSPA